MNNENNDALKLDSLVKSMAAGHQPELPSAGVIWWRAQILKKQAEKERVERPVVIMGTLAAALCLVMVVALWISQPEATRAILGSVDGFAAFLIAGAVIGIGFIALTLWSTLRLKGQT
jgi:hypothetical protein